jgi:hypothetical protein
MALAFDRAQPSPSRSAANRLAQGSGSRSATYQSLPFPADAEQAATDTGCAARPVCGRSAAEERLTLRAQTATVRITATIFLRDPCNSHIRATIIISPDRSATSRSRVVRKKSGLSGASKRGFSGSMPSRVFSLRFVLQIGAIRICRSLRSRWQSMHGRGRIPWENRRGLLPIYWATVEPQPDSRSILLLSSSVPEVQARLIPG